MNQPIDKESMTNTDDSHQEPSRARYRNRSAVMVAIILIAVFASAISVYSTSNSTTVAAPNQVHVGLQQVNASVSATVSLGTSSHSSQTQQSSQTTVMSSSSQSGSATQAATTTQTSVTTVMPQNCYNGCYPYYPYYPSYPYPGYPGYPGYPAYPAYPSYTNAYGGCIYSSGYSANVQCYGYIYQVSNGCVELVVPVMNPYTYTSALQYYTLHGQSSYPSNGTWVTVKGQMYQGYNNSPTGAACPGNYINVSSVVTA